MDTIGLEFSTPSPEQKEPTMKRWMTGRGPVPSPPSPNDLPLDQRERLRLLKLYSGNLEAALIAWTHHTHFQWGRWLVETGRIGVGDR